MNKIKIIFLLTFIGITMNAQNKKIIDNHRLVAKKAIAKNDFVKAANELQAAHSMDPDNQKVSKELLEVYVFTQKSDRGLKLVNSLLEKDPKNVVYLEAKADFLFNGKKYQEAYDLYSTLKSETVQQTEIERLNKKAQMAGFKINGQEIKLPDDYKFNPKRLSENINNYDYQYCPIISIDGKSLIYTEQYSKNGWRNEDIFISKFVKNKWTEGRSISENINTDDNEGAHSVAPNGKYMVLTICNREDGVGGCDLYISENKNSEWSEPKNLGKEVNSKVWDAHPAISADGKTIYFSSERKGSKGSADIWYTTKENGKWATPVNIDSVNTVNREYTPYIHPDNTSLYFVSDGHPGVGDLDLFISRRQADGNWGKPINFGSEINTTGEEYSLSVAADGKTAYYAKTTEKSPEDNFSDPTSDMDIYTFELPPNVQANPVFYFRGNILDKYHNPVKKSNIKIYNLNNSDIIVSEANNTGKFFYSFPTKDKYAIQVSAQGFLLESFRFEFTKLGSSAAIDKDIELKPIEKEAKIELKNILFLYGSADLDTSSYFELNNLVSFLTENKDVYLEVGGHTDSIGSKKYNYKLSTGRAKSVRSYLISQQIDSTRLTYRGYADDQPVASNSTEEGRIKNRRTEVRILSSVDDSDSSPSDTVQSAAKKESIFFEEPKEKAIKEEKPKEK